jgi:hypothetical protein
LSRDWTLSYSSKLYIAWRTVALLEQIFRIFGLSEASGMTRPMNWMRRPEVNSVAGLPRGSWTAACRKQHLPFLASATVFVTPKLGSGVQPLAICTVFRRAIFKLTILRGDREPSAILTVVRALVSKNVKLYTLLVIR